MAKSKIRFIEKPSCTTCKKAKAFLQKLGAELETRALDKDQLNKAEIEQLIGERDYIPFLSTRNELYKAKKMKENPPTRAQAIALMAENPNLIRRPVVVKGTKLVLGYDEEGYKELVK